MSDAALIAFFKANADLFINNSIADSTGRWFGWGFLSVITWIAEKCQSLYDYSFGLVDFTAYSKMNSFINAFKPAFIGFLALSLLALGIILILHHEKKPKILINIIIAVLLISSGTVVFQQLNSLTMSFKKGIDSINVTGEKFDGVYDVVSNNLFDIVYLDKKLGMKNINFKKNEKKLPHPNITKNNYSYIDYREVLNPNTDLHYKSKDDAEDILEKKLVAIDYEKGKGKFELRDVYNGFGWNSEDDTDLANEFYYRYKFNFFTALLQLLSLIIIYAAMSYKCVRIVFELAVARLFAYLYSAEVSGGQKIAKILVFIRDSYILLIVTCLCIRIFYLFNAFIAAKVSNGFALGVLSLFAAFVVIDGPNLVEKLLGMDAGLRSSTARMVAAYGMVKGAASTVVGTGRSVAGAFGQHIRSSRENDRLAERMQSGRDSKEKMNNEMSDSNKDGSSKNEQDKNAPGKNGHEDNLRAGMDMNDEQSGTMPEQSRGEHGENGARDNSFMDSAGMDEKDYMSAAGEGEMTGKEIEGVGAAKAADSRSPQDGLFDAEDKGSFMDMESNNIGSGSSESVSDSNVHSFMETEKTKEESSFVKPKSEYKSEMMDRLNNNRKDGQQ